MKKILALILALSMLLAFAACGEEPEEKKPQTDEKAPVETPVTDEKAPIVAEDPKAEEPEKEEPKSEEPKAEEPVFLEKLPSGKTETPVEEYFKLNAKDFLAFVCDNYARASGTVCTGKLAAVGNTVTVDICIGGLVDVNEEMKAQVQNTYSTFGDIYSQLFEDLKRDVPELETMTINLCEEDGDILVPIKHGK